MSPKFQSRFQKPRKFQLHVRLRPSSLLRLASALHGLGPQCPAYPACPNLQPMKG